MALKLVISCPFELSSLFSSHLAKSHGLFKSEMSILQAPSERLPINTHLICPFVKMLSFTVERGVETIRTISHLFDSCRPTNISRLVSTFVVDPVNGMLRRGLMSNLSEKVFESVKMRMDSNPALHVVIHGGLWVFASAPSSHRLPCLVLGSSRHAVFEVHSSIINRNTLCLSA